MYIWDVVVLGMAAAELVLAVQRSFLRGIRQAIKLESPFLYSYDVTIADMVTSLVTTLV